jgi:hypothetical protein
MMLPQVQLKLRIGIIRLWLRNGLRFNEFVKSYEAVLVAKAGLYHTAKETLRHRAGAGGLGFRFRLSLLLPLSAADSNIPTDGPLQLMAPFAESLRRGMVLVIDSTLLLARKWS